jgi:restriction system protein
MGAVIRVHAAVLADATVIKDPSKAPSILLQTVVELGEKTEDGHLIQAVTLPWFEIIKLIETDPSVVYQINPRKWEEMIAGWYAQAGFEEVTLTPRSGDLGRDVIAVKRGIVSVRVIDQVKAHGPNHLVSAVDVRALLGVLQADHGATKGFVTTTSDFAPRIHEDKFIEPFIPYRLELINGTELVRRLTRVATADRG